jgi:signal transduction histidine kinase
MAEKKNIDLRSTFAPGIPLLRQDVVKFQQILSNLLSNAIKFTPEGGRVLLKTETDGVHLVVTVADTGVGFGNGGTSGTGVGLANIRERLQLLYGDKATLTVTANQPSGTVVTITVPYRSIGTTGDAPNGNGAPAQA